MLKNIQIKVVLTFFVLGLIFITGLGMFFLNSAADIFGTIQADETIREEIYHKIGDVQNNMQMAIYAALGLFAFISILVGIFVSIIVNKPIKNLLDKAKRIASGEIIEEKEIGRRKKEEDELVETFNIATLELKEKLSEVSQQKKQIETILLHMTDGIIAFNIEGEIILTNAAAKRLLNILPEDNTFHKVFDKLNLNINMEKIIYLENLTSQEQRVQIDDRYVDLFFELLKDETERTVGMMTVIQDITEHVKLDNMRKEFVADVSHELKTPITSIMGYSDTLLESEYDKEMQDRFLTVISTEARRMAKLVTDLLSLSRYDTNEAKVEKVEFDLGELTKKCQEKLQIEIEKKKHHVECFVTADVPKVYADKEGIERVVLNILSNSIKYTKEKGTIKIYVGFVYNDAYIKIIDNGYGIPKEDLTRIFERFYRVDKARTREMGGTGLRTFYCKGNFR